MSDFLKEKEDTILDKNEVYWRLFEGQKIKPEEMFSTISYYSPLGDKRFQTHNSVNVSRYNNYLRHRLFMARKHDKL